MGSASVLTIREAEAALGLSGPRIHQLLADGELDGPALPPGRKRHPPGAPRVFRGSVARYLTARESERSDSRAQVPTSRGMGAPARKSGQPATVPPGHAAAQELKVKLDTMRDELSAERARNRDLVEVVEKLVSILRSAQASADQLDLVSDGYSSALTQLLTPETLE